MMRGAGREVNNRCNKYFSVFCRSSKGRAKTELPAREEHIPKPKPLQHLKWQLALPNSNSLYSIPHNRQTPNVKRRFVLRMAPHHRRRRSLCLHCPQQKNRVKTAATKPNLSVTCKQETKKLMSLVPSEHRTTQGWRTKSDLACFAFDRWQEMFFNRRLMLNVDFGPVRRTPTSFFWLYLQNAPKSPHISKSFMNM